MLQLCVCRDIEHLGSLESTQEARVALGCASCNSYASLTNSRGSRVAGRGSRVHSRGRGSKVAVAGPMSRQGKMIWGSR